MSLQPSEFKHVVTDPGGVAYIAGTTMKVRELVLEQKAYGWTADQLIKQHPYLSMAQIHAALAYYFDHSAVMDSEIEQDLLSVEKLGIVGLEQGAKQRIAEGRQS